MRIEQVAFAHPDAQHLVEAVQNEYVVRYGSRDETPMEHGDLDPPDGRFYVMYQDIPVACGAWRWRDGVTFEGLGPAAEIKRMYVLPDARHRGLARELLAHLETAARSEGAAVMVLETGTAQPEAIGLYEASGYWPMEPFGFYSNSTLARYYGKVL